jgi:hypothetical protein
MKKKWLICGAVAVGAYLIWKKMKKDTDDNGKELAPPPVSKPPVSKPPVSYRPKETLQVSTNKI